ncbi:HD-GYP domain-containing protein [candidate division KSB1 bacterium]
MKKTIPINALKVGMYLAEPAYDSQGDLLLAEEIILTSPNQIRRLKDAGVQVIYIDPEKGEDCQPGEEIVLPEEDEFEPAESPLGDSLAAGTGRSRLATFRAPPKHHVKPASFPEEIKRADQIKREATQLARSCYEEARKSGVVATDETRGLVSDIIDSLGRNKFAMLSLVKLKEYDEYTYNHSVNVTTLSLVVARQMNLEHEQLEELGTRAFLHDIGKMRIPQNILTKGSKLNEQEWAEMKKHTGYGVETLLESGFTKEETVIAEQHHERHNGSGYNQGLKGDAIHVYAQLAALADVYDALTTRRAYKAPMIPHLAMASLFKEKGVGFAPEIVMNFVKTIGVFPIGSVVRLSSGEVAVVVSVNVHDLTKPRVAVLFTRRGIMKRQPMLMDLVEHSPLGIAEALDPREWKINVEEFISKASD